MAENYGVYFGKEKAGNVRVRRQGLYYYFSCRCHYFGEGICRLRVHCCEREENLGVLIPMGDSFGLETKLPIKRLGEGSMAFFLVPNHGKKGKFSPIYPEEPFAYIAQLKDTFLEYQNGQMGVHIKTGTE